MDDTSTLPTLSGVLNFREMGGLRAADGTVRHGQLLRSGHLATATDDDVAALGSLGLHSIVDFRQDVDRRGDGGHDRVPEGVELIELPVADPAGVGKEIREVLMSGDAERISARYGNGRAAQEALDNAVGLAVEPDAHATFGAFLAHVVASDGPVLWHCSAGKDRAGWAATVLGMALGVDDDQLVEHYLLSNIHRPVEGRLDHYRSLGVDVEIMIPFLRVDESYLRASLAAVDEGWPSREAYLSEALGVGPAEIDLLRTRYLG